MSDLTTPIPRGRRLITLPGYLGRRQHHNIGNKGGLEPKKYLPHIVDELLTRMGRTEPLMEICEDEHMPAWKTVQNWRLKHEEFSEAYDLACEAQAHGCVDKALAAAHKLLLNPSRDLYQVPLIMTDVPIVGVRST